MSKSFAAQVGAWASKSEAKLTATRRRAIELLADEMALTQPVGGRVPFETGALARSLLASTSGMPKTSESLKAGGNVGAVVAMLPLNKAIWLGYQSVYARRQNYGYVGADVLGRVYNQQGSYFVEYAIAMWPTIVELAAEDLQTKVEARKK